MPNQPVRKFEFPLVFIPLGIGAILAYEWLRPKVDRYEARVNADSFAKAYLAQKIEASKGNLEAKQFLEAANRRLRKHSDDALMGNTESRLFLEALRSKGVVEKDYL
jgi:hypothetical protein